MKKLICLLLLGLGIISCGDNKQGTKSTDTEITNTENTPNSSEEEKIVKNNNAFSWDAVPISKKDIGVFPFFTPPKGMIIDENTSSTESINFSKLEMYDGKSYFEIEGPVEKMRIIMEDSEENFGQYYFDKSVKDYLESIGAVQIYNAKVPDNKQQKEWDNYDYTFMLGIRSSDELVKMYVIHTPNSKIGIQILSNSIGADMAIVESKGFEQTIEKITADMMKQAIDNEGYVALSINFDTGKSRIKSESYTIINEITTMLKDNPEMSISIEGHTDDVGDDTANLNLSKNRAKAVLLALTDEGIDESRLKSDGFGETDPVSDNSTEEGRAKNRRVELKKI